MGQLTGILREVRAQLVGVLAETAEDGGDVLDVRFGVTEDQRRCRVFYLDDPHQEAVFLHCGDVVVNVLDLSNVHAVAAQAEEVRIFQELGSRIMPIRLRPTKIRKTCMPIALVQGSLLVRSKYPPRSRKMSTYLVA